MSEAVLRAVFVADERAYTGARCELPLGEVVEVTGRKTPFFALCRELEKRGYGDCRIEISTPEGTPDILSHGVVLPLGFATPGA